MKHTQHNILTNHKAESKVIASFAGSDVEDDKILIGLSSYKASTISKVMPKLVLGSLVASVLSACSSIPPVADHTTIIAEPNILINQPYVTMDDPTVSTDKYPNIAIHRWEVFYSDPKLRQLIHIALKENKDLEGALLAIKQSQAQFKISDNALLPKIGGSAGYNRSAAHAVDKNPNGRYSAGLALSSYELDLWGRIASLKENALQQYLATTAGKDAVQIALISNVAQTYVNLSYARAQYKLAKSTVESRERSLFITQKRFEAGVDNKSPSLQAESSLESAKVAMYDAETTIIKLRNALELMLGMPIPVPLEPEAGITEIATPKIFNAGLPSDLLHYRPDVLQAEYNLKAAGANIDAARAAYFPSISLTGNLGLASPKLDSLFKNNALSWSFGPSVNIPIFDAGQLDSNYEISKIARNSALARYEKSIQTAFREVSDVLADRATIEKRLASQYKLQNNFNETYVIANARYKSGLSDYLSVLDAERSKFSAQQSILQLEQAKLISQIQLYQVLGGGVEMDVPVQLTIPNQSKELIEFIAGNQTKIDASNRNATITSTNVARSATESRLATQQDYIEKQEYMSKKNEGEHIVNDKDKVSQAVEHTADNVETYMKKAYEDMKKEVSDSPTDTDSTNQLSTEPTTRTTVTFPSSEEASLPDTDTFNK